MQMWRTYGRKLNVLLAAIIGIWTPLCLTDKAYSQDQPSGKETNVSNVVTFERDFFTGAGVNTALDMIERTPGFVLSETDENVRGLGGAFGNVLIDGSRPSTKTRSLSTALSQIPADRVERIEVRRGAGGSIDTQTAQTVANVVTRSDVSSSGVFDLALNVPERGSVRPIVDFSNIRNFGKNSIDLNANFFSERLVELASDTFTSPGGEFQQLTNETVQQPFWEAAAGLVYKRTFSDDRTFTFTTNFEASRFDEDLDSEIFGLNEELSALEDSSLSSQTQELELSGDYEVKSESGATTKIVVLQSFYRETFDEDFAQLPVNSPSTLSVFSEELFQTESIGRVNHARLFGEKSTIEIGGEIAFNRLTGETQFFEGSDAETFPSSLPSSDVTVSELRGDIFGFWKHKIRDNLNLDLGLALEASRISQSGDTDLTREFFFVKPTIRITWRPDQKNRLTFFIDREVDQLEFGDFVTSADLNDSQFNVGNPDLSPQSDYSFGVELEHAFTQDSSITLNSDFQLIQDANDLIPIGGVFDAPGNIGDAERFAVTVQATTPLSFVGLSNTVFDGSFTYTDSTATDPVTGESRMITGDSKFAVTGEIRADFPALKSTLTLFTEWTSSASEFRLFEIEETRRDPFVEVAWEYAFRKKYTLRFALQNIIDAQSSRTRTIFGDGRSTLSPTQFQDRIARRGIVARVRLRRTF